MAKKKALLQPKSVNIKNKNPSPGDKVELIVNGKSESGTLLDSHEQGVILLKLENGYNVGIKKDDVQLIKIIEKSEKPKEQKTEFKLSGQKPLS